MMSRLFERKFFERGATTTTLEPVANQLPQRQA